jgi:ATP-dependent DNA helicase RecQ
MNRNLRQIVTDTFRENLMLSTVQAQNKGEKIQELLHLVQALPGSGIVYARSRKDCEEMAGMLRDQGVKAEHYHAGISERALVQDRFMRGDTRVIVATIAFGMGVDKSDIRFIIHFTLPSSLEAYYQEAGRAGRDGDKAHCILLYTYSDQSTLKRFVTQDALNVDYLRNLYRAVRQGLRGESAGILHLDTLRDTLKSDDTGVRVGLGTLEQAGLLQRHYDAPRTITLTRHTAGKCPPFDQMAEQASLRVGQTVTRNFLDLVAYSGIDVPDLEQNLLGWETDGHLTFSPRGREALLSLLPAPKDSSKRIDRLISQYNAMQQQKVAEIGSYGQTRKCRHGYLANYLGSQARTTCTSCDNCVGELIMPQTNDQLPALDKQKKWVLQTLREQSWGRSTLSKLLRGDKTAPERAWDSNFFGRLHFRTHSAITRLVDGLIDDGLLMENTLHHGGVTLEITDLGESFLRSGNLPVR